MSLIELKYLEATDSAATVLSKHQDNITALEGLFNTNLLTDEYFAKHANINGSKIADASLTSAKFKDYRIDSAHYAPTVEMVQIASSHNFSSTNTWENVGMDFNLNLGYNYGIHVTAAFTVAGLVNAAGQLEIRFLVDSVDTGQHVWVKAPNAEDKFRMTIPGHWRSLVASGAHTYEIEARIVTDHTQGSPKLKKHSYLIYEVFSQ